MSEGVAVGIHVFALSSEQGTGRVCPVEKIWSYRGAARVGPPKCLLVQRTKICANPVEDQRGDLFVYGLCGIILVGTIRVVD